MSFAQAIHNLWPFHGSPDPRSDREIDDDVEAEFGFHLEQSAKDLLEQGQPHEAARALARERFGDVERYKHQCRRIALKERIMLQRVNFVMMIFVLAVVIVVGVNVWLTQKYNTIALQDIASQVAKMRLDAAAEARERGLGAPGGSPIDPAKQVLIEGAVERAGWHDVGEFKYLHELVERAGPKVESVAVYYTRSGANRASRYEWEVLRDGSEQIVLGPGDRIRIAISDEQSRTSNEGPTRNEYQGLDSGEWLQFDPSSWQPVPKGARIAILGKADIRNISGQPGGVALLPGDQSEIGLMFNPQSSSPTNLLLYQANNGKTEVVNSRWSMDDDGNLTINFAPMRTSMGQPLVFRRVGDSEDLLNHLGSLVASLRKMEFETPTNLFESETPSPGSESPTEASPQPSHASDDPSGVAPFRGVKWAEWTPYVDVQTQWYELLTVDGIPVSLLIDHCKSTQAEKARECFSERLVQTLTELGRTVGDAVKLEVRDPATGTRLSIDKAALTADNHQRVVNLNKSARDAGESFPVYQTP